MDKGVGWMSVEEAEGVRLRIPVELAMRRFEERVTGGKRHIGHADDGNVNEFQARFLRDSSVQPFDNSTATQRL